MSELPTLEQTYENMASFEIPYTAAENAPFPYVEKIADLANSILTETQVYNLQVVRQNDEDKSFFGLKSISATRPEAITDVFGHYGVKQVTKKYTNRVLHLRPRYDMGFLKSAAKKLVREGVSNPENGFSDLTMHYLGNSQKPMTEFTYSAHKRGDFNAAQTFYSVHGLVHVEAKEDHLDVTLLGDYKLDETDAQLFFETLNYARRRDIPITFNDEGLKKGYEEHLKPKSPDMSLSGSLKRFFGS